MKTCSLFIKNILKNGFCAFYKMLWRKYCSCNVVFAMPIVFFYQLNAGTFARCGKNYLQAKTILYHIGLPKFAKKNQ